MPAVFYCRYERGASGAWETAALEHRLGRELLERVLRESFGLAFSAEELAAALGVTANGKPFLKDYPAIHFNISHCGGLVACAAGDRPLGIDVERPGTFPEVLIRRVLAAEERRLLEETRGDAARFQRLFCRFWTLKEAYVKRSGEGMDAAVRSVAFRLDAERTRRGDFETGAGQVVPCTDSGVFCWQTELPGGYILALCADGSGSFPTIREERISR